MPLALYRKLQKLNIMRNIMTTYLIIWQLIFSEEFAGRLRPSVSVGADNFTELQSCRQIINKR